MDTIKKQLEGLRDGWLQDNTHLHLKRVSLIEGKWKNIQSDWDTRDGIFAFFCIAAFYNFMGGGEGKITIFRNHYDQIIRRDFNGLASSYQSLLEKLSKKVDELKEIYPTQTLKAWWESYKDKYPDDRKLAARKLFNELFELRYIRPSLRGKKQKSVPIFTSKAFWIARELHANEIWSDFPLEYTCVPDNKVQRVLNQELETGGHLGLFLLSELMSGVFNQKQVDGFYPYDLPAFEVPLKPS